MSTAHTDFSNTRVKGCGKHWLIGLHNCVAKNCVVNKMAKNIYVKWKGMSNGYTIKLDN